MGIARSGAPVPEEFNARKPRHWRARHNERTLSGVSTRPRRKDRAMTSTPDDSQIKDPELYEALREDGASKEKAARISNAAARDGRSAVGSRGGAAGDYEDHTVDELKARARELGLSGYSKLRKRELIELLRTH